MDIKVASALSHGYLATGSSHIAAGEIFLETLMNVNVAS
jgi:hypothetical protein